MVAEGLEICYVVKSVLSHVLMYAYVGKYTQSAKNEMEDHELINLHGNLRCT
jgi:hypothetical protein